MRKEWKPAQGLKTVEEYQEYIEALFEELNDVIGKYWTMVSALEKISSFNWANYEFLVACIGEMKAIAFDTLEKITNGVKQ